jgi:2-amino-4-hydroxy-6-hydroxymethyldihydropteridine diphosphokinase
MGSQTISYIALGSNLGDRLEHLRNGAQLLEAHQGIRITSKSRIFETEPSAARTIKART